jgi:hypothetical protein
MVFAPTAGLSAQWAAYAKGWMEGTIYPGQTIPSQFQATSGKSSLGFLGSTQTFSGSSLTLTYSGTDLSGQLYYIAFPGSLNWQTGTKMTFTLTGPNGGAAPGATALIYKVQSLKATAYQTLTSYGGVAATYSESNAENFISQNASLAILLMNDHFQSPFATASPVTLTLQVNTATPTGARITSVQLGMPGFPCSGTASSGATTCNFLGPGLTDVAGAFNVGSLGSWTMSPAIPINWSGNSFSGSYSASSSGGTITYNISGTGSDALPTTISGVQFSLNYKLPAPPYLSPDYSGSFSMTVNGLGNRAFSGSDTYGGLSYTVSGAPFVTAMNSIQMNITAWNGTETNSAWNPASPGSIILLFPCTQNGQACTDTSYTPR